MKKLNLVKSLTRVINNIPALRGKARMGFLCLSLATFGVNEAWGNSVDVSSFSSTTISGSHTTFSFSELSFSIDGKKLKSSDITKKSTVSFTLTSSPNTGCTLNITKVQVWGYMYGSNTVNLTVGTTTKDIHSLGADGVDGSYTEVSSEKQDGFGSSVSMKIESNLSNPRPLRIRRVIITYTITPNAPTITKSSETIIVSLNDENKLDMSTLISVADENDFFPVAFKSNGFTQTQGVGAADGYFTGKYFYAKQAGVYTYTTPYITAKENCHAASGDGFGSVTITVNRLQPTVEMNKGEVTVSTDAAKHTLDLNSLKKSTNKTNGTYTYELLGTDAEKRGASISGSTFQSTVGGTFKVRATTSQTGQYESTTCDFQVTVNRLTPTVTWTPNEETVVAEDQIAVTSAPGVELNLSVEGDGAEYVTIDNENKIFIIEDYSGATPITATLKVASDQTDVYQAISGLSKAITISNLTKQYIIWNQDQALTKLKITDNPRSIVLTATSDNGGLISRYVLEGETAGFSLSQNGNTWTLNYPNTASKGAFVRAELDGVEDQYLPAAPISLPIKVIDPTSACDITENLATVSGLKNDKKEYALAIPKSVYLHVRRTNREWYALYTNGIEIEFQNAQGSRVGSVVTRSQDDIDDDCDITIDNLDRSITKMIFKSNAGYGYDITVANYTHYSEIGKDKDNLVFETYVGTPVDNQQVTINYANHQIEVSIEDVKIDGAANASSNFTIVSSSSFGDCGVSGSNIVTIGYTNPGYPCTETATLCVRDNTDALLTSLPLSATVLGGLDQHISFINLPQTFSTTDKVTLQATSDRDFDHQFTYSVVSGYTDVAKVEGDKLTFLKDGDFKLRVYEPGTKLYTEAEAFTDVLHVSKVTPTIVTLPTAGNSITYGEPLSAAILNGGKAMVDDEEIEGTWAWAEKDAIKTANNGVAKEYEVIFTPTKSEIYDKVSCLVSVLINRANQVISWNEGSILVYQKDVPSTLIATALGGRVVHYTISPEGLATVTDAASNAPITPMKVGEGTITAQVADDADYNASSVVTKTLRVQGVPTFTWQIEKPRPNSSYHNFFSTDNDVTALTFSSSNPSVAKVENGVLYTMVAGTTQITVTQAGNDLWTERTEVYTVNVVESSNRIPCTLTKDNYNNYKIGGSGNFSWDGGMKLGNGGGGFNWDDKTFILEFEGIPDKLNFTYNCANVSLTVTNPEWYIQESADGQTWSENKWTSAYTGTSEKSLESPIQLAPTTRYLKFCYSGNFAGVYKNISIFERKYFYVKDNVQDNITEVNLGTFQGNAEYHSATIYLVHANAGANLEIKIGDTQNFRLNYNIVTGQDKMGNDPIEIIYRPSALGVHNTQLTISDGQNTPIQITIKAQASLGARYCFVGTDEDSDASKLSNWILEGTATAPSALPTFCNPIEVRKKMILRGKLEVYKVIFNTSQYPDGQLVIAPTGGLVVGVGAIENATVNNLRIQSSREHQGYLLISPVYDGVSPVATIEYATRSTLSTGANDDATWQYFGIPVNESEFTVDYITWMYEWSESQNWINLRDNKPHTLRPFQGYAITQYGQPTYEFAGQIIRSNIEIPLTYTPAGMQGQNLIANSYSSPIDAKRFTIDDFEVPADDAMDYTFYIFNSGSWNQWNTQAEAGQALGNDAPGTYTAIPALSANMLGSEAVTLIAPMQGIYLQTYQPDCSIKLNYAKHVWYAAPSGKLDDMNNPLRAPRRASMEEEDNHVMTEIEASRARDCAVRDSLANIDQQAVNELTHRARITVVGDNSGADHIYLLEKDGFTPNYDNGYDARKMWAENGSANIYTTDQDGYMAVSATNQLEGTYIGIVAGQASTYHLTISSVIGEELFLKDLITEVEIPIQEGETYHFNMVPNTDNDFRFMVVRHEEHDTPTSDDQVLDNMYIWTDNHNLHIENASASSLASLYAADGKLLFSEKIAHSAAINIDHLPNSVYLVNVDGKQMKFVKK